MKFEAYLAFHGTSLADIERQVLSQVETGLGDILFLAGSLLEDLGNENSDVDALLISDRQPRGAAGEGLIHVSSRPPMDVEWWSHTRLEGLLARLEALPPGEDREPASSLHVPQGELQLLHRLRTGLPLLGAEGFDRLRRRLPVQALARILFDRALVAVRAHQIDVDGFLRDGDPESALLQCEEMVGYTADALLAATGCTQTSRKWRWRRLRGLPEIPLPGGPLRPSAAEAFLRLHLGRPRSEGAIRERAHRAVRLANRVLPWGQSTFLGPPAENPEPAAVPAESGGLLLGRLVLDAQVERMDGRLRLARFRTDREIVLGGPDYEALLCFDGRRSAGQAAIVLARRLGILRREALGVLLALRARLKRAGFLDPPAEGLR